MERDEHPIKNLTQYKIHLKTLSPEKLEERRKWMQGWIDNEDVQLPLARQLLAAIESEQNGTAQVLEQLVLF